MIKILIAIAILCGAVFLGPRLADSQGFIHIATDNYIIETSLTTAFIVVGVAFLILHIVINIINGSVKLPSLTARYFSSKRLQKKQSLQNEAFLAYEEGSYTRALGLLKKCGQAKELPASCLFLGAKSAFSVGDFETCRNYLDLAEQSHGISKSASKILRAKLNLKINNISAALENLAQVENNSYTQAIVTKLYYECYSKEDNLVKLKELLPSLKKHHSLNDEEQLSLTKRILMQDLAQAQNSEDVLRLIDGLSRQEKTEGSLMMPLVSKLVSFGAVTEAGRYALTLIKDNLSDEYLEQIATWQNAVPEVLSELEKQNTQERQDALPFIMALANLELKSDKVAEAENHIMHALELKSDRATYLMAAELNEKQAKYDEATKYFSLALKS